MQRVTLFFRSTGASEQFLWSRSSTSATAVLLLFASPLCCCSGLFIPTATSQAMLNSNIVGLLVLIFLSWEHSDLYVLTPLVLGKRKLWVRRRLQVSLQPQPLFTYLRKLWQTANSWSQTINLNLIEPCTDLAFLGKIFEWLAFDSVCCYHFAPHRDRPGTFNSISTPGQGAQVVQLG